MEPHPGHSQSHEELPIPDEDLRAELLSGVATDKGPKRGARKGNVSPKIQQQLMEASRSGDFASLMNSEGNFGHLYDMWRTGPEPNAKSGFLWKKAGGKTGASPRRSNWNRRWFKLEGPRLAYFEDQEADGMEPAWEGDLTYAQVDPETETLQCEIHFDEKSRRFVMSITFTDRVLRIGTAKDIKEEEKEEQLKRLRQWEWSLNRQVSTFCCSNLLLNHNHRYR